MVKGFDYRGWWIFPQGYTGRKLYEARSGKQSDPEKRAQGLYVWLSDNSLEGLLDKVDSKEDWKVGSIETAIEEISDILARLRGRLT